MRAISMVIFRYARWDGSQEVGAPDPQDLLKELGDDILNYGDLGVALRRLLQRGVRDRSGVAVPGLQELLRRLRQKRQEQLSRHNLSGITADIQRRLDEILRTERQGIQDRLGQARQRDNADDDLPSDERAQMLRTLERLAAEHLATLDRVPEDMAGRMRDLSHYDFMDPEARRLFQDLQEILQQRMLDSFFNNISQQLQQMSPQDLARLRQMTQALNELLQKKLRGVEPDFEAFREQYGDFFPGIESLDQLIESIQRQIGQMQSLLDSMSSEQRQALRDLMRSLVEDAGLQDDLADLAWSLEQLLPVRSLRSRYPFSGDDPVTLTEAMRLMEHLQQLDDLERQLRRGEQELDLDEIDREALQRLLGEEAGNILDALREMRESLERAGYVKQEGDRWELTARGVRMIGQKALQDIFQHLRKEAFGPHATHFRGAGAERDEETKRWEFGDPFEIDIERTIRNHLVKGNIGTPVRLGIDDFEVFSSRLFTRTDTVLMLDLSWSMDMRGCFLAAKKVALALNNLIRLQFPKDTLSVVGFAGYAREFSVEEITHAVAGAYARGTNIQHALMVGRQILNRNAGTNKQIILITDAQPTAHMEDGRAFVSFPATVKTLRLTLQEARLCARQGITINTFMMDDDYYLRQFVHEISKVNRGRVFFASPERLGEYVVVDYLNHKRRHIA